MSRVVAGYTRVEHRIWGLSVVRVPSEWLEKAKFFYERARSDLEQGVYWAACFEAHQSVELILKGLQVAIIGVHEFTHDLVRLLRGLQEAGLEVPEELIVYADALTPHYTMARYPGRKPVVYDEDAGRRCVEYARRLWEWAESVAKDP
ncbi:HEPN domain protein [Pyrolobus fumarii 1A]|uniref:HEPN domain protein n=1 Tax=Pyrolobus fumarii (strain DSM 11204 / 1A) TaxID=694429 RepID=G0EG09_PYRF1|nr:HEPN domain-containing protein [Pyrolobus fumarii]AEM39110.1 HEPN domain protein [Pyrolobus fumarii 1A]